MPNPFVYHTDQNPYADSIGRLLLQRGEIEANRSTQVANAQARAAQASGEAWGGAVQSIGKTIGAIPGEIAEQKKQGMAMEAAQLQMDTARRKATAEKTVAALPYMASGEGRNAMLAALDGDARELAMEHYQKADEADARLKQIAASTNAANLNADESKLKIQAAELDYFGALASGVKAHNYDPGAFSMAVADAVGKGRMTLEQAGPMVAHGIQNPAWIKQATDELIARSPEQQQLEEKRVQEQRAAATSTAAAANLEADNKRADAAAVETARHNAAMEKRPVGGGGAAATGSMTPDGLELAATTYRLTKALPARNAGQNGAIISAAAAQAKALGNSPAATIQRQAAYAGDAKALAKIQGMSASAEAFEQKATQQAGIVRELSDKVNRTQFPILNTAIVAGKADLLGDKDAQLLYNSITTFASEYAKIMEGSTGSAAGSSDASRAAAQRLISAKLNKGTMAGTLDLMQREMQLTLQGYDATIAHITERMGGTTAPAAAAPDLSGLVPGHGRTFSAGPYAGQTWTLGPDGKPSRVK